MPDEFSQQTPSGRVGSNGAEAHHDDEEISLIDLLLVVARYKRVILMTIGVFFVVGFLYAL
ncbi:MAG: hypothetical protein HKO76_02950, partial [Acidimicrobiia bacterium]|nr:hypothetical protein [Acidimicrobiia bacterium]